MRKISEAQAALIREVVAEQPATYPPAALEKDLHLTEILKALRLQTNQEVDLAFGGGTSLVKGYRLFDRMSEDLDFKFQLTNDTSKSQQRNTLRAFRIDICSLIESLGYQVLASSTNSEGQHFVFDLEYENAFDPIVSLRPNIKLEFFSGEQIAPNTVQPMISLLDLAIGSTQSEFSFQCTNMNQIAGEKILGFLNRFYSLRDKGDERLIRHIHDIHFITSLGDNTQYIGNLFPKIIAEEINRFKNQYPYPFNDPINHLSNNLELLRNDQTLPKIYESFVSELTLGTAPPFVVAKNSFIHLANACIKALATAIPQP